MKRGAVFLIGLAMAVLPGGGDLAAQTATPPVSFADDFEAHADSMHALTRDRFELVGNVTFKAAGIVIQADRLVYDRATRSGEAHGNVLYAQAVGRLAGDRITFNIEERTAEITNVTGYLEQGVIFRARRLLQIDDEHMRIEKAMFTSCTQPVPYWSFRVSSALIIRDRYAHLFNPRLKAGVVPVFYSPYLFFPIKTDRATGLLLPQIGFSDRLGSSLSNALFWAIARNQDATFFLDNYSEGSTGLGVEHRLLPSARGRSQFSGYFLDEKGLDDIDGPERERWNVRYRLQQEFGRKGRLLAHFNLVSDGDYFLDFSRDLDRGSDPSALSRANYAVGRGYLALNMRLERREQFFVDDSVVQSRLPEAEIRLRSRRLGRSPLYLSLVSSAAILDKSGTGFPAGSYGRVDLFPAISAPMSPTPWLDVTPTLQLRETYYTRALDPADPTQFGDDLAREFMLFDTQFLGPRLSRIFFDDEGNGRLKSTIEPRLTYRYLRSPDAEENARILRFDEIDLLPGDLNEIQYGVVSRLFARKVVRTRAPPDREEGESQGIGSEASQTDMEAPGPSSTGLPGVLREENDLSLPLGEEKEGVILTSPVEIMNVSLTQRFSFDRTLSQELQFLDTDGDGVETLETLAESHFSSVVLNTRINPSRSTSLDARLGYDILESAVSDASFSASLFNPNYGFLNGSWFFRNGLDGRTLNSSRLRVTGGTSFFRHKISVAVSLNYDASLSRLQDQRYRVGYDTQCCGFAVEVLDRDFVGTEQKTYRFVINLRGIGNFLDLQDGGSGR
ncbi:MAG: LPS assembly protein LptD [Acidobacteria bacterium]|nr:LPS assembly protein LptD [Acidobacteriota bacterium]